MAKERKEISQEELDRIWNKLCEIDRKKDEQYQKEHPVPEPMSDMYKRWEADNEDWFCKDHSETDL